MKTKKQFLSLCKRMGACWPAIEHIKAHASLSAYPIISGLPDWQLWFLTRRLTKEGLELLASRLGVLVSDFYVTDALGRPPPHELHRKDFLRNVFYSVRCQCDGETLGRVVDDCWRAWCRSK